jgi:hypothetical protein
LFNEQTALPCKRDAGKKQSAARAPGRRHD